MPPLLPWAYLAMLVIMVNHRVYTWMRLYMTLLSQLLEPSGTLSTEEQGRRLLLVGDNLVSPCPVAKVCGVFSIRVLPSDGQPIAIACTIWGCTQDTLDPQLMGEYPIPETGLLFDNLWNLRRTLLSI